ncbi:MAG: hypothetical protein WC905_01475 [Patescibacteria group bacterium]|jgi:hypothetical protein
MNIIIPKYITNYNLSPFKTEKDANDYGLSFNEKSDIPDKYVIYWGLQPYVANYGVKYGVMETGFFNEGMFIDTIGNYQHSSLNTKTAYNLIENFDLNGRISAKDLIFNLKPEHQSKYNAIYSDKDMPSEWTGPILALQNPGDRSILAVTNQAMYYTFVEECCKFYGKKLFVKMHPWNSGEVYNKFAAIANKYGCLYGKAPIDIIKRAEFVIAYNSTFAIDCLIRDVPYVQYGIGTFFNAYGVIYSSNKFPLEIHKKENGQNLCDFLIHRYCFRKDMTQDYYVKIFKVFSESNEMFPLKDELSYASTTQTI